MKKKIRLFLVKQSKNLSKIPSLLYLLIYLIIIPLFAWIFTFFPSHFYHSTVQHENSYKEIKNEIKDSLVQSIRTTYLMKDKLKKDKKNKNRLIFQDSIFLDFKPQGDIKANEESIELDLLLWILKKGGILSTGATFETIQHEAKISLEIFPSLTSRTPTESYKNGQMALSNKVKLNGDLQHGLIKALSTFRIPRNKPKGTATNLVTKEKTKELMRTYLEASKGFPHNMDGNFIRMMYLSASTLTTLGLGDIAPITWQARGLIILETMIGIILIGLFVNSLGNEILNPK